MKSPPSHGGGDLRVPVQGARYWGVVGVVPPVSGAGVTGGCGVVGV